MTSHASHSPLVETMSGVFWGKGQRRCICRIRSQSCILCRYVCVCVCFFVCVCVCVCVVNRAPEEMYGVYERRVVFFVGGCVCVCVFLCVCVCVCVCVCGLWSNL